VDEAALLRDAAGKHADAAKALLKELWQHKRLSPATRRAIVKQFLVVELVEKQRDPKHPAWRELRIRARRDFPFPDAAWIEPRCDFGIGAAPKLAGGWGARTLGGTDPLDLGSMGGKYGGAPVARAVLEVREVDHARDGAVLWTLRWSLGPLKLRRAP
jgi:hypothetical protein